MAFSSPVISDLRNLGFICVYLCVCGRGGYAATSEILLEVRSILHGCGKIPALYICIYSSILVYEVHIVHIIPYMCSSIMHVDPCVHAVCVVAGCGVWRCTPVMRTLKRLAGNVL